MITRANDRLNHLMEGTAFLARNAARQRSRKPLARSSFTPSQSDTSSAAISRPPWTSVLEEIERRLTWRPRPQTPLFERIIRIGNALLTLKEIEYIGRQQTLDIKARLDTMIDALLVPLEQEWLKGKRDGDVVARVKSIRAAMLPEMIAGEITEPERAAGGNKLPTRIWPLTGLSLSARILRLPSHPGTTAGNRRAVRGRPDRHGSPPPPHPRGAAGRRGHPRRPGPGSQRRDRSAHGPAAHGSGNNAGPA